VINIETIKKIGDKQMDRKDFLKFSGLALVAVVGFKPIVNFLTQPEKKVTIIETHHEATRGFGGGKYGA